MTNERSATPVGIMYEYVRICHYDAIYTLSGEELVVENVSLKAWDGQCWFPIDVHQQSNTNKNALSGGKVNWKLTLMWNSHQHHPEILHHISF